MYGFLLFSLVMKRAAILALLLFFLLPNRAYAFDILGLQPIAPYGIFSTFSAESLSKNKAAFETALEKSVDPDFYRVALLGAYGISDSLEFDITVPYVLHYSDYGDGMEDIALGFKHRFYDGGKYGPALAYVINASINNGRDQFSTNGSFGVGLIVSKRVGPFKGHFNVFYERPGSGKLLDELSFRGGVEFSAAHNFAILSELIVQKDYFTNEYQHVEARFGYRLRTTNDIYTTIGGGLDLKDRNPQFRILFSVSFTLPPGKKSIRKIYEQE
jgi:hypothetical protein